MNATPYLRTGLVAIILSAVGSALCGHKASAQSSTPVQAKTPTHQSPPSSAEATIAQDAQTLINVNFGGGSVGDYVGALRQANEPVGVNVVMSADAAATTMNAVSLKAVSVQSAMSVITHAASTPGRLLEVEQINAFEASTPVFAVRAVSNSAITNSVRSGRPVSSGDRILEVFSIDDLITNPGELRERPDLAIGTENLLAAIELATASIKNDLAEPPEVLFHRDSNLLIARGDIEQVRAVKSVIERLTDDVKRKREAALAAADRANALAAETAMCEAHLSRSAAKVEERAKLLEMARADHDRALALFRSGATPETESQASERQLLAAESQLQAAKAELEEARARVEDLQTRVSRATKIGSPTDQATTTVVYDLRDLPTRMAAIRRVADALKDSAGLPKVEQVSPEPTLAVVGTIQQHAVLAAVVEALREPPAAQVR